MERRHTKYKKNKTFENVKDWGWRGDLAVRSTGSSRRPGFGFQFPHGSPLSVTLAPGNLIPFSGLWALGITNSE